MSKVKLGEEIAVIKATQATMRDDLTEIKGILKENLDLKADVKISKWLAGIAVTVALGGGGTILAEVLGGLK